MRHRNMHGSNLGRRQRPYNPTQNIACRLCNHVFVSTRALINHIESHMVEADSAASRTRRALQQIITNRLPSQRDNLIVNSFMPNYFATCFPTPSRGTRPFFVNRLRPRPPPVQPSAPRAQERYMITNRIVAARPFRPPLLVSPMARNIDGFSLAPVRFVPAAAAAAAPQAQTTTNAEEEPPTTRPFLNQLDHPIMAMVEVIEIEDDDNNEISGSNELDLDLKL
ncbi:hypothetical protein I3843_02G096000 [Carya illinoinensis]|uniref:C2H2-type domain-containing protein n=1 Tax=Carya illinoinensis TaxID=32201 RepID=A0A922FRA1_CARIL|nr:hypothetical protein I3842_02G109500 [Carya illinoinensis]KAG7991793.1 hypothetical protein I3843_02G096000 [Carya illinoinensis]